MNKKTIIVAVTMAVVVSGSAVAYASTINNRKKANDLHTTTMKRDAEVAAMAKEKATDADAAIHSDVVAKQPNSQAAGSYISLADFNKDPAAYNDYKKVLFFHASWCPVCQSIHKEIVADPTKIPAKTVLIKTDYDTNTALRKTYGVTQQYTFVQLNNNQGLVKKWVAPSLADALAGV